MGLKGIIALSAKIIIQSPIAYIKEAVGHLQTRRQFSFLNINIVLIRCALHPITEKSFARIIIFENNTDTPVHLTGGCRC